MNMVMVPTLRHLRLRAAQTMASSRVKFAQFVEDELRHLHVEKRCPLGCMMSAWHELEKSEFAS